MVGSHFKSGSITTADFPLESNDINIAPKNILPGPPRHSTFDIIITDGHEFK
jgi:hypothetical protein